MAKNIPNHIGIIMDGNGRWAEARGLARTVGHREGANTLKKLCKHISKRGIKYLSVYAFSTENFKRPKVEVDFLMDLFYKLFLKENSFISDNNIRVVFSGRRDLLSDKVLKAMDTLTDESKNNSGMLINICLNYGSQSEIVDMTRKIAELYKNDDINLDDIDIELVRKNLYQDLPPLDYVIRTSGEIRLSNFMMFQSSYAEFYFPEVLFPDFLEDEFDKALEQYKNRDRRFGGLNKK